MSWDSAEEAVGLVLGCDGWLARDEVTGGTWYRESGQSERAGDEVKAGANKKGRKVYGID